MSCQPVCDCNFTMSNTGTDCRPLIQVVKKPIFTPTYDSTGARNFIDLTDTVDAALFTGLINEADASKRIFPLPDVIDVDDKRADPTVQNLSDGRKIFIKDGTRTFVGMIWGKDGNTVLKSKIDAARCGDVSVYLVDRLGNLIGIVSDDKTKLYPIRLDANSISAQYINATDTTTQGIRLSFDFDPSESDGCIGMITAAELTDAQPLLFRGLLDVTALYTTPVAAGLTFTPKTDYGTPMNPVLVKGLLAADMAFYNVTTSSAIAITGTGAAFSESNGVYTILYATADQPVATNVIRLTVTKAGYDWSGVLAATFVTG